MLQKGFAPIVLILGILLISSGIIGGAYYFKTTLEKPKVPEQKPTTPKATPTPTSVDETANWETYEDAKWDFQIKHPRGWKSSVINYYDVNSPNANNPDYASYYQANISSPDKEGFGKGAEKPTISKYTLIITVYSKKKPLTLLEEAKFRGQEFPQCMLGDSCDQIPAKEVAKISNDRFKEFYTVTTSNNLKHTIIPFPDNSGYYVDIETWYTWPRNELDLYEKILSTFKFLD